MAGGGVQAELIALQPAADVAEDPAQQGRQDDQRDGQDGADTGADQDLAPALGRRRGSVSSPVVAAGCAWRARVGGGGDPALLLLVAGPVAGTGAACVRADDCSVRSAAAVACLSRWSRVGAVLMPPPGSTARTAAVLI